jgi:signal transduction histidine kinase
MSVTRFFTSRDAAISFLVIVASFITILVASIYIFNSYNTVLRRDPGKNQLISELMRVIAVANTFPIDQANAELQQAEHRGFRAKLTRQTVPNANEVDGMNRSIIATMVSSEKNFNLVFPLSSGSYLHVWSTAPRYQWSTIGFIFSLLVLLLALLSICMWSIRRLATPIAEIGIAASRFGRDVNAPPLASTGSADAKAVINAFNDMQSRIRRLINDRTQMLAAISHDLRTPITRLKLRVEYLKDKDQYEKALIDLNQMENMITSILSFARDHVREEAVSTFDLNGLLESMCDDLSDAGNDIEYQGLSGRVPYSSRIIAMKRAFANLIDNAIKYGKEVSVILEKQNNNFIIQIKDSGPGIPDQEKERAFTPFYRVDQARSSEIHGTGLGMAVARDIILAAGGEIELRDALPHGLIVIIRLPMN